MECDQTSTNGSLWRSFIQYGTLLCNTRYPDINISFAHRSYHVGDVRIYIKGSELGWERTRHSCYIQSIMKQCATKNNIHLIFGEYWVYQRWMRQAAVYYCLIKNFFFAETSNFFSCLFIMQMAQWRYITSIQEKQSSSRTARGLEFRWLRLLEPFKHKIWANEKLHYHSKVFV